MQRTDTLIIGGGQAGLALSHALTREGHDHVVLERGRIGERWRSQSWDSLRLLTPNWLNALPGSPAHPDPDGHLRARDFAKYLQGYAASFGAPVLEQAPVRDVALSAGGFRVDSDAGWWLARNVVLATGECAVPLVPAGVAGMPTGVTQLHASRYRRPEALPAGGVLVVGAGPTGQQLALDLRRADRHVVLAAGRHARTPRRYRGRDVFAWLDALGDLRQTIDAMPDPAAARRAPNPVVTGGGERLDLGVLHDAGVVVTGRLRWLGDGVAECDAAALSDAVRDADAGLASLLDRVDALVADHAFDVPAADRPAPVRLPEGPSTIRLRAAGIRTVIWATGYRRAYPWLRVPVLGTRGDVVHRQGATSVPGLHVLGMRLQRHRFSHAIGGVGSDAAALARSLVATPLLQEAA